MWNLFFMLGLACLAKERPFTALPPPQSLRTQSGLAYQIVRKGRGSVPQKDDLATIRYRGWNRAGVLVGEYSRNSIRTVPISRMEPVWQEALSMMRRGSIYRFWLPSVKEDRSDSVTVFEMELLSFAPPYDPLRPPRDLRPPNDAQITQSGLAFKRLRKGTGKRYPTLNSIVTVRYTGWKSDGTNIDSSYLHGKSMSFPLRKVVAGWREGLQLMKPGEKTIFWIPERLAYGENPRPGAPAGDLIFMVELISFENPSGTAKVTP